MRERGKVGAVVAAAGECRRMKGVDKIFFEILGRPLIAWTIEAFESSPLVDEIVLVLHSKNLERGRKLLEEEKWKKVKAICPGGPRRQDSVREGLERLRDCRWVLIHDGARPCITQDLIERGLKEAEKTGAAVPGLPAMETVKLIDIEKMKIERTLRRDQIWLVQTPQIFSYELLMRAEREIEEEVTDEASLVERLGVEVKIFPGSRDNIKVTFPEDLEIAELILSRRAAKCASVSE